MKRRRPVRRIITQAIVFLLLGAIVNVAVAFLLTQRPFERLCGRKMLGGGASLLATPPHKEILLITTYPGWGWLTVESQYWIPEVTEEFLEAYAPEMTVNTFDDARYNTRDSLTRQHFAEWCTLNSKTHYYLNGRPKCVSQSAFGWPSHSLMYEVLGSEPDRPAQDRHLRGGIALTTNPALRWKRKIARADALPLIPIWPGFAINTIFYAAVLWVLFAAPFTFRRWRRIKRGLCPACAYDLRGSASQTCPECGKAVRISK